MPGLNLHRIVTILVAFLLLVGTTGYVIIENYPIEDAVYMTVITLSTVGFGEVNELSPTGRFFTSILITFSFVLIACWTAGFTSILVSGELSGRFQNQRTRRMISKLNDHTVICGGGVTAITIVQRLLGEGTPVVVITEDPAEIAAIRRESPDIPIVEADPKSEFALIDANVFAAKNLVAAVDSDYDNLLITITGKGLGTDLRVVACAQDTELASRMMKVGADDVICPLIIGGEHAARLLVDASGTAVVGDV